MFVSERYQFVSCLGIPQLAVGGRAKVNHSHNYYTTMSRDRHLIAPQEDDITGLFPAEFQELVNKIL